MKLEFLCAYRISENYLNYLINGTTDNLEYQEIENIDQFMQQFENQHIEYLYEYENIDFTRCAIHGLHDNCCLINIYEILE